MGSVRGWPYFLFGARRCVTAPFAKTKCIKLSVFASACAAPVALSESHIFIGGTSIGGLATGTPGLKALLNQGDLRQKLADARAL